MATPVASLPAVLPTAPAGVPATGPTQPRTVGTDSPFQTILANANPAPQATTTDTATDTLDTETNDPTTDTLDASLIGLQVLVTQVLAPPENAAIAQATGQTALTEQAAAIPVDVTAAARTRADELRLDRSAGVVATTQATPQAPLAAPQATTTQPTVTTTQAVTADNTPPALPTTQPTTTTAAPPAAPSVATFAARPGGSSSIPAQGQIVATVVPAVPVPTGLSVTAPPASEPTAAVPATALPSAQLGDRPATAGERFAADAAAGARLGAPATPTAGAFADTLNRELTAPIANPIPVATGSVRVEPVLPGAVPSVVGTTRVANEPAVAVNFSQPVAEFPPPAPVFPALTAVNFRPGAEAVLPTVETPAPKDESRPADATAATPPVIPESRFPRTEAPRAPTGTPAPARANPAAQLADTIVSHARVIERDGKVEFQMRLDPPELGQMQVRLVTRGTEVHGQVLVASEAVRGLIESQLPELRQRLEAAGVTVQRFDVSTDPGTGGNRNPYREAVGQEYFPRTSLPGAAPRIATSRGRAGTLDVTV